MKTKTRFLTKSRFKIGSECPTKLYFLGKSEYGNNNLDNQFLEALAEGGFQVGELAKLYHPGGVCIDTLDVAQALDRTNSLLSEDRCVLFEGAIAHGDLLIRADILIKKGQHVEIVEVKAKSFDPRLDDQFYNKASLKKGVLKLSSDWKPYLLDIAFQKYVVQKAFPTWKVSCSLMLADKSATASVDGINQLFFIEKNQQGRTSVSVSPNAKPDSLGDKLLVKVNVDSEIKLIFENGVDEVPFDELVTSLATAYVKDKMITPKVGSQCKGCEFRIDDKKKSNGSKSAFDECWKKTNKLTENDLRQPMVFEIWNFRKTQKMIEDNKFFINDLEKEDIAPQSKDEPGLSSSERQWLQIEKIQSNDSAPYLDIDGMRDEMARWKYPFHFIDFETTMVAIPFHKGRHPYEQIAFQFSHHTLDKEGRIEHRTQYINVEVGKFPNFDFVRNLKAALDNDDGTIFRYAAHENTVLCQIYRQLKQSGESDKDDLMSWIRTVTTASDDSTETWDGPRTMIDMCDLVKKYFHHPATHGSNSIKKVLPAILGSSTFLASKYSRPIYGHRNGIVSKNFNEWQWIQKDRNGNVADPYKLLPPIFSDLDLETMDRLITDGSIADGGAAMTAYVRMQFTQMSDEERTKVASALLKYCELDTFAMVMIYEYWSDLINARVGDKAA